MPGGVNITYQIHMISISTGFAKEFNTSKCFIDIDITGVCDNFNFTITAYDDHGGLSSVAYSMYNISSLGMFVHVCWQYSHGYSYVVYYCIQHSSRIIIAPPPPPPPPTPHPTPGPDVSNIVSSLNTIVEKDKDVSFLVKFEVSNYYT